MCGIAGFYSKSERWSQQDLMLMTRRLNHRGPDAEGFYWSDGAGLGHKRLSIIDLSENANQPMVSECGNYVIVFNGEIYNFKDIASELNEPLKTSSDTEVVLKAYIKWGIGFISRLNGMFAIALYDVQKSELLLIRDRIGIKPIYYYSNNGNFAFASELKALKALPGVLSSSNLNHEAIFHFLHLGYIPQPLTIYSHIHKFPSGSYAVIDKNGLKISKYWSLDDKVASTACVDEQEMKQQLKALLIDSVRLRMFADVPFGTFLSGGVDSSLVTAIAQSVSAEPINTFSIKFDYNKYDESKYSREISSYLGTKHHEYTATEKDALALIPDIINIYDEPFADSSAIPTLLVSKMAREKVTMTLSGDGGDELFMGYGAYHWANRLSMPAVRCSRWLLASALSMHNNRSRRAAQLFNYPDDKGLAAHIFSQEQYFYTLKEIGSIFLSEQAPYKVVFSDKPQLLRKLSPAEWQAYFDLNYYLKDDLLVKVDRASMHHALEVRVPILDYRVVEFAINLSEKLKINNGQSKYLLKQVLYDFLPAQIFNRPKWGFSIPLVHWLKKDLKYLSDHYLDEARIRSQQMFNYKEIEKIKHLFYIKNRDYLYNRLWNLIVLQMFFDKED